MALQAVNVGAIPNDGTGDDPRTGISKVNANMVLLEATGVNGADQVFTEANLNTNVFGGLQSLDTLGIGFAQTATDAVFTLPISSLTAPVSVSLVSTLGILSTSFSSLEAGITSVTLSSRSSNKVALLLITATGLTAGDTIQLTGETATSKITVNF